MIKKSIIGLILACAACCTVPLLFPLLAGASVMGVSLFGMKLSLESLLCGAGLAVLAFIAVYVLTRAIVKKRAAQRKSGCATDGSCGCK